MKIGYARVSTDDQDTAAQMPELRAVCDRVVEEKGSTRDPLPLRDAMLAELAAGDQLIVWRLDRVGRSVQELVNIMADLEARGVTFMALRERIDASTPAGRLTGHISSAFAQFEREVLSERTRAGMAARKRAGVHIGRPKALTPQQVELAARMMDEDNASLRATAAAFKVSHSTLGMAIKRRILKGKGD